VTVADTSYGTERLYSYAAVVKSVSPEPSPKPVSELPKPQRKKRVRASKVCKDNVDGFECSVCCRRFSTERGLKIHSTKSHKVDGDGSAVVVSGVGVPDVSRTNAVTSHN